MSEIAYRIPQQRRLVTDLPGPRSVELTERRRNAVGAGVMSSVPVYTADADGGIIIDVDGNSLVDLGSGIAVTSVGASDPAVVKAIQEQAAHFTHTCFMVTPYEGYIAVAEKLAELTPGDHAKRTVLFNSGAEAVENAVKIARVATGRKTVVVFDHGYHGRTNLTMAMTAKNKPYKEGFGPFAADVHRVAASYPFRDDLNHDGTPISGPQAAQRAIMQIDKQIGTHNVAAIVIEPIQGEGGFIVPARGFLPALADWAKAHGIVFVADEVQTGLARTGRWFACDDEGVVPDLVTIAKGVAGGMPLAAVTGRADLIDAVHGGGLGGTYGGNPVACAAALATMERMEELDLCGRARHIEQIATERLRALADEVDVIGEVRGRGAMLAIELVLPGTREPNPEAAAAIAARALAEGVILLTCGTYGNVIRLLPPLVISDDLLLDGLEVLGDAVRAVAGALVGAPQ
ncbi:4-aminobutyrate--2-oxoglutarate transaminase [Rhodococcus coprophilus]|uniref:4-aminobutyrate aminotransferase n=1 Tax=Rhodococcus coprophilus TaxID=38310 RepID=A0A2X4X0A1_9NOCA|nr:4-aminobutyrate--2-oxoglutarate transaminase [Rhodococcus coprophilus]MBM7457515.1 4-aminobutyrate aminotransferase/(S)-3-amino-2-methylpropionate transaminase [Rhodococcus coprophilus]SQI29874.1 4-aminobutyrate aminotransferase [Rhodococcus coprophilus]